MSNATLEIITILSKIRELVKDPNDTASLESFWEEWKEKEEGTTATEDVSQPDSTPKERRIRGYKRTRGMSNAPATLGHVQSLSEHHPATSLPDFLRTFGPLVFPLYRAALLRKRVLLAGEAPVLTNCNYGMSDWLSIRSKLTLRSI